MVSFNVATLSFSWRARGAVDDLGAFGLQTMFSLKILDNGQKMLLHTVAAAGASHEEMILGEKGCTFPSTVRTGV
jgi:hypothetical protein